MVLPLAKKTVEKFSFFRKNYVPNIVTAVKQTRNEFFFFACVSLHEFVYWGLYNKEKRLAENLKAIEMQREKFKQEGLSV
mmetsp:Transcript_10894/g.21293  ORF Transcript_10894/g.21293 Transcript_10894/m.21293 type:complete len:80 (-) Transcript_10894:952-1191(-)